ncbi:MAG: DinB family protein [Dehalococcoidia bacterium]
MTAETAALAIVFERIGRDVLAQLEGLSDEQLNRPVQLPETNTLFQLATHLVGSSEFWVLTMAGGRPTTRNRDAEFVARGGLVELRGRYERWLRDVQAVLEALPPAALDQQAEPPAAYRSSLDDGPMTVRDCLLHALEHGALHQGHIQLTRQLLG